MDDAHALRAVLLRAGDIEEAARVTLAARALVAAPDEPVHYLLLADELARTPSPHAPPSATAAATAGRLLLAVVLRRWHARYDLLELVALMAFVELASRVAAVDDGAGRLRALLAATRRERATLAAAAPFALTPALPMRLRIVVTWDAPDTDVELVVVEPDGARVDALSPLGPHTRAHQSRDVAAGCGPVEYVATAALTGRYRVAVALVHRDRRVLLPAVSVRVRVTTTSGDAWYARAVDERLFVETMARVGEQRHVCSIDMG